MSNEFNGELDRWLAQSFRRMATSLRSQSINVRSEVRRRVEHVRRERAEASGGQDALIATTLGLLINTVGAILNESIQYKKPSEGTSNAD